MTKQQVFEIFKIEDLHDLPGIITKILEGDNAARDEIYLQLLEANNHDLSYEWFQNVYESELSERGQKKQDFTPRSVSKLASMLTGIPHGVIHEPTAGNGSMLIADWNNRLNQVSPWEYWPSQHMVDCWELSARSIPILLLNLSIRGMMGYVYHGDVLTQEVKCKYILLNRKNDAFAFSEIIKDEENKMKIYGKDKV